MAAQDDVGAETSKAEPESVPDEPPKLVDDSLGGAAAAADVPLPPPPPEEAAEAEKEDASLPPPPPEEMASPPEEKAKEEQKEWKEEAVEPPRPPPQQEMEDAAVSRSPPPPAAESPAPQEPSGPSQGASLFGLPDEPEVKPEDEEEEAEKQPTMTTGDAIFADLPVAGPASTGANLFGTSEEGAAGSTGASIFEVSAPKEAKPQLGEMSGWDEDFDAKFNTASMAAEGGGVGGAGGGGAAGGGPIFPGDPTDPFAGTGAGLMPGASAGGFGTGDFNPSAKPTSFGVADEVNPFAAEAKAAVGGGAEDEGGDSPLFDDDTSKPLEPFPRVGTKPDGWEFFIRHPPKKKIGTQR